MSTRGGYAGLRRRVEVAERRLRVVAPAAPGCPTCAGWPAHAAVYAEQEYDRAASRPWACRASARPSGAECLGCRECHPRGLWPADLRCPDCGREPETIVRLGYGAPWRGRRAG